MAAHLSIGTALDKNRISSSDVYLVLMEVDILDPTTGLLIETIYCTNNTEPYYWVGTGQTYISIPFEAELTQDNQTAPTCTLIVYDLGEIFQAQLQAYGWSLAWPVRFKIVNTAHPGNTPEIEQDFEILSAVCAEGSNAITFTIGAENPLTLSFPPRQQFRNRCFWQYKDSNCNYVGSNPTCDLGYDSANGCKAHGQSGTIASIARTNNIATVIMAAAPSPAFTLGTSVIIQTSVGFNLATEGSGITIVNPTTFTYYSYGVNVSPITVGAGTWSNSEGNIANYGGFRGLDQVQGGQG